MASVDLKLILPKTYQDGSLDQWIRSFLIKLISLMMFGES